MWFNALLLTLELVGLSVMIAAALGIPAGVAAARLTLGSSSTRWRNLFIASIAAGLAIPLVMHAAAWESAAGKFGWLPLTQTGARVGQFVPGIQFGGLIASAWIHGVYGSAIVAVATWCGVRSIAKSVHDAATIDSHAMTRLLRIELPLAMPWISAGLVGVAAIAASEMVVADLYGLRTIADEFYLFHATSPSWSSILMVTTLPMLLGCLLAWMAASANRPEMGIAESGVVVNPTRDSQFLHALVLLLFCTVLLIVPLSSLVIKAGHEVTVTEDGRSIQWSLSSCVANLAEATALFGQEYQWTILIALMGSGFAIACAAVTVALASSSNRVTSLMDAAMIVSYLVPGPLVGLMVVRIFQLEIPTFQTLYQSTVFPTCLATMPRTVPVAYWILRLANDSIPDSIRQSAAIDARPMARFLGVTIPSVRFVFPFLIATTMLVSSGDVPTMLPVMPPGVTTVGTRIFSLLHSGSRYQEASLAFWYVFAAVALLIIGTCWMRRTTR